MKKKVFFYAFIALFFTMFLTSCSKTDKPKYRMDDTELSKIAYGELKKSYDSLDYEEFLSIGYAVEEKKGYNFNYDLSSVYVKTDGTFVNKNIRIGNDEEYSVYENYGWTVYRKSKYIKGHQKDTYKLTLDDSGHKSQIFEYTYDQNENVVTSIVTNFYNDEYNSKGYCYYDVNGRSSSISYKYINNDWLKMKETKVYGEESKVTYSLELNKDNTIKSKKEYTYDDNGNELTCVEYDYKNDEWVRTRESYKKKEVYSIFFKQDNIDCVNETTYDEDGKKLKQVATYYKNKEFSMKEERKFDENENLLSLTYFEYLNNEWLKRSECVFISGKSYLIYYATFNVDNYIKYVNEYTYNENGIKTSCITTFYKNNEYDHKEKFEYEYNENGQKISEIHSNYENNEWVYDTMYEKTYYDSGCCKTITNLEYENNAWVYLEKSEYEDNNKSRLISKIKYKNNDYNKIEYTYDENGQIISELHSNYKNNAWSLAYKNEYTYDGNGHKVRNIITYYQNNEYESKYDYFFDDKGEELKCISYTYENGVWAYNGKEEYIYDEKTKTRSEIKSYYIDEAWINYSKTEYVYDEKGNNIIRISSKYENNAWVYSSKKEFTRNEKGYVISETEYEYINGEWVKK